MAFVIVEEDGRGPEPASTPRARWGVVTALMLIYLVSYIDRQSLTIVVEPVKRSLSLSDTQIGLLQGFIFTTVMIVSAVPMAYLIDRFNRITILFCCMLAWSVATICCGFAGSFGELAAGRIGVAIAEAVVPMAAMSIIGDLFPRNQVGSAAGVFMNGSYFGNGLALLIGGSLLTQFYPYHGEVLPLLGSFEEWRGLFISVGLLGIVVACGLRLVLREPRRREMPVPVTAAESFVGFMIAHRGFIGIYCLFAGFLSLIGFCLYAWPATLLIRVHGMTPRNVGFIMGPMFLLTSIPGTALATWLGAQCRPERALQHLMKVMIGLISVLLPSVVGMALAPANIALIFVGTTLFLYAACHCAILVPIQLVTPNRMRGRIAAVTSMIYVIPAGLGPVMIGYLTDHVFKDPMCLGSSIAIVMGGSAAMALVAGAFALKAARLFENTKLQRMRGGP